MRVFGPGIQKSRPSLIKAPFLSKDLIDDVRCEMVTLKIVCPKLVRAGSQPQQKFHLEHQHECRAELLGMNSNASPTWHVVWVHHQESDLLESYCGGSGYFTNKIIVPQTSMAHGSARMTGIDTKNGRASKNSTTSSECIGLINLTDTIGS